MDKYMTLSGNENICKKNMKENINKKHRGEIEECIICFELIDPNNHMYCKSCNNTYHTKCLIEWQKKSKSYVCTYCQQPTLKKRKNYFKILKKCFSTMFT